MIFRRFAIIISAAVLAFTLGCIGCGSHDASDPYYGEMYKQATRDRVSGNEFWGSRSQKDCTSAGAIEVCSPQK